MNLHNAAPVTGIPTGVVYAAGLACGVGLAWINIQNIWALITGRIGFDDLVPQIETEEMLSANVPHQDKTRS